MRAVKYRATTVGSKPRSTWRRLQLVNRHYQRTGFYDLVLSNLWKLCAIIAMLIALYSVFRPYLAGFERDLLRIVRDDVPYPYVLVVFYLSESVLGLIPPDFFMLWAKLRFPEMPYTVVTLLASISYLGGITAYGIGRRVEHIPRVHRFIFDRHPEIVRFMRKWGGVFVVTAALLPIPFAVASSAAGLVEYNFKAYLLYGLTRFIRFYVSAWLIFSVV